MVSHHHRFHCVTLKAEALLYPAKPFSMNMNSFNWEKKHTFPAPLLTDRQKKRRLDWGPAHSNFDWMKDFSLTDESSVLLHLTFFNQWGRGEEKNQTLVFDFERPKHCPKLHTWGGVSSLGGGGGRGWWLFYVFAAFRSRLAG